MRNVRCWLFALALSAPCAAMAQRADSLLTQAALLSQDTLTIIDLIDSLLFLEDQLGSQLGLRLGYNSNVASAGRTLGIENFGLAPAISYYHKSGAYLDVTGYWSKDFEPEYYLTVASLGYMYDISKHFSVMANYDRYFYSEGNYIPYQNTLAVTPMAEFKKEKYKWYGAASISFNYSYYFGDQNAHRVLPGVGLTLAKRDVWILDRMALLPAFYMLWGNVTLTKLEFPDRWKNLQNTVVKTEYDVYGIMNYSLTVPLSMTYKNWCLIFTYAYNVPKALEGEPLTISESTYLSGSLTYLINLRSRKKPL